MPPKVYADLPHRHLGDAPGVVALRRHNGHYAPVAKHRSERLVTVGAYVTMGGGSLVILDYYITHPVVGVVGVIAFILGIILVGVGGGLRNAWRAFWTFFP